MYVGMDFKDANGNHCELVAQTPFTLCAQFSWNLFPTRWFQNAGHTIIFEGKDFIEAKDDSGQVTVQINQLLPHGTFQSAPHRHMLGHLTLETWNHLSFFPYSLHYRQQEQNTIPFLAAATSVECIRHVHAQASVY